MPIYEYGCSKCGHEFEAEQRITENPLKTCPQCRARKLRRLISRTSFVLKGSGWYADLYSSAGAGKKAEAADKPASDAGGSSGDAGSSDAAGSSGGPSKSSKSKAKKKGSQAAA